MLVKRNLWENKEKHPKRILKANAVSVTNLDDRNVRVSNCINVIDKENFVFIFQEDYKNP